ncbi:extracellular solute-binding protein [Saccharopolyspora sp. NPDC002686]|uniref:ABC transporter substrate-binding protein n=1 Tax=Saccharopolyspora sp. NPDC002686 TaxID=3154541 RepID=UPI00331AFAAB
MPGAVHLSRRQCLGASALLLSGLLFSGCAAPSTAAEPVTIQMVINKLEIVDYMRDVIDKFERSHPGIKVDLVLGEAGFVPSLVRDSPPDVTTRGWAEASASLAQRGVFSDLSGLDAAKAVEPKYQKLVDEWGSYDPNATVALPFSVTAAGVIYNKDLFKKYGVAVPTTWDEFRAACEKFQENGVTPIYGTYQTPWTIGQGMLDYAVGGTTDVASFFASLNKVGSKFAPNGNVTFSHAFTKALPAMEYLRTVTQPNASSQTYSNGNAAMAKGKAAMYLQGPWALSAIHSINSEVNLGSFPLPVTNDPADTKVRVSVDMAISIPEGARHPEEARQFVEFLFQPDIINKYNRDNAAYSTLKNAPSQADPRIEGLTSYIESGKFYQGTLTYLPVSVPVRAYVQSFALGGDGKTFLRAIDEQWARVAARTTFLGEQ